MRIRRQPSSIRCDDVIVMYIDVLRSRSFIHRRSSRGSRYFASMRRRGQSTSMSSVHCVRIDNHANRFNALETAHTLIRATIELVVRACEAAAKNECAARCRSNGGI